MELFSTLYLYSRRFRRQSGRRFFYLAGLLLVIGVYFSLNHEIFHRRCSLEIPICVQKMLENVQFPFILPESSPDHWQPVTASADVFVYSAYYEKKDRIRIIGAISTTFSTNEDLYCILWYGDVARTLGLAKASVVYINESHNKRFTAAYFVCPIGENSVPARVSLADKRHVNSPSNFLTVHSQVASSPPFNVTACVSPIYANPINSLTERLVEWIEINKVLGVELFTVYVHSISGSELKVLNYYESTETLEIMNWTLSEETSENSDRPVAEDIHYLGQIAALNDCLYRNKGRSMYTVAIDLDELIVPHVQQDFTLMEVMNRLPSKSAYLFRHSFFRTETRSDHMQVKDYSFDVHMIDRFLRCHEVKTGADRSKMIFKPDEVVTVGIHNTWAILEPCEEYVVDPDIAMLHHYRTGTEADGLAVTDRATEKYLEKVLANMNWTLNAMQNFTN